ncbi:MAG TPA: sugar phosphate isomerase/epimerase family protein [Isosphaeraceae bacterium]|jgi:sugar phosphate isomerase/epimerase|nr:sugar phosphate isomerase/epimerase family protein [Isosphaeraceae bacterium]
MSQTTRRAFLTRSALTAAAGFHALSRSSWAHDPIGRTRPSHFKLRLAAYSYRDYLSGPARTMDLFGFVDMAADLGLDAVELTSYYFPDDVSAAYLNRLKMHAFRQGLDVSGTAVMDDFCLPPGPAADKEVEHVRTWIGRAAALDAPVVRVMSGNWIQGTPDEELEQRVVQRIESLLPYAAEKGVMLALENHGGGVTVTDEQLLRLVRAIKGQNFGVNLDTGNFHGPDPYAEIAQAAPYAVNVQVKTEIRRKGKSKEPADLARVIVILREAKYSGYVVLEYNASEDSKEAVPRYLKQLRPLIS